MGEDHRLFFSLSVRPTQQAACSQPAAIFRFPLPFFFLSSFHPPSTFCMYLCSLLSSLPLFPSSLHSTLYIIPLFFCLSIPLPLFVTILAPDLITQTHQHTNAPSPSNSLGHHDHPSSCYFLVFSNAALSCTGHRCWGFWSEAGQHSACFWPHYRDAFYASLPDNSNSNTNKVRLHRREPDQSSLFLH